MKTYTLTVALTALVAYEVAAQDSFYELGSY